MRSTTFPALSINSTVKVTSHSSSVGFSTSNTSRSVVVSSDGGAAVRTPSTVLAYPLPRFVIVNDLICTGPATVVSAWALPNSNGTV